MLEGLGIPYAIIRPTLVFGEGDLLLNNIAWALRRFPVFPVYGSGDYQVQPVYVEDLAAQAVESGFQSGSSVADAAGPETFSFKALLRLLASSMGVRSRLLHTPPSLALALTGLVGLLMRDLALTRDEVDGLMAGLLTSDARSDRHDQAERLAQGQRGRPRPQVHVRTAAQLQAVVAVVTSRVRGGS